MPGQGPKGANQVSPSACSTGRETSRPLTSSRISKL